MATCVHNSMYFTLFIDQTLLKLLCLYPPVISYFYVTAKNMNKHIIRDMLLQIFFLSVIASGLFFVVSLLFVLGWCHQGFRGQQSAKE